MNESDRNLTPASKQTVRIKLLPVTWCCLRTHFARTKPESNSFPQGIKHLIPVIAGAAHPVAVQHKKCYYSAKNIPVNSSVPLKVQFIQITKEHQHVPSSEQFTEYTFNWFNYILFLKYSLFKSSLQSVKFIILTNRDTDVSKSGHIKPSAWRNTTLGKPAL